MCFLFVFPFICFFGHTLTMLLLALFDSPIAVFEIKNLKFHINMGLFVHIYCYPKDPLLSKNLTKLITNLILITILIINPIFIYAVFFFKLSCIGSINITSSRIRTLIIFSKEIAKQNHIRFYSRCLKTRKPFFSQR